MFTGEAGVEEAAVTTGEKLAPRGLNSWAFRLSSNAFALGFSLNSLALRN